MAHLTDAEKTRAMALRIFDLDAKDNGRMRFNAPSSIQHVLMDDPSLISDPAELKKMIASETNPRKFFILASMADHFMNTQKADFVAEMAPMLFRHEPVAKMVGEYYLESLTNASFFSYGMIIQNLKILNADFIPAEEKLPYPDKISILVKWLKANYPGCENLGEKAASSQELRGLQATERLAARQEKRIPVQSEDKSSKRVSAGMPWWLISSVATTLVIVLGMWFKLKYPTGLT